MDQNKKIFLVLIGIILLAIIFWPKHTFKIARVIDGQTIQLTNGAQIRLIGVSSTDLAKAELESIIGEVVELVPDCDYYFNPQDIKESDYVYSYILLKDYEYECINSTILKKGLCKLDETHLRDSILSFRKYADNPEEKPKVIPKPVEPVVPIIDYEDDDIILPSPNGKRERKHSAWYIDGNMNLDMLDEACDYTCPYTKQFANSLAGKSPGNFNAGQICEIFDYCYNKWKYVNDPNGQEYLASASESIEGNLAGDCDDFAILIASCVLAIGGDACVNTGQGSQGGHAFAEVDIAPIGESNMQSAIRSHFSNASSQLNVRKENGHIWLNLDWWASHPGGPYYDCYERDAYPCVHGNWSWQKL